MENKNVVICGDVKRNMPYLRMFLRRWSAKMSLFTEITHILFGAKISQMPLLTEMEYKNVVICGDMKGNIPLFTYVFAQMECENVVIYGDNAHSFRSQNTQMSLFTYMEYKNAVI